MSRDTVEIDGKALELPGPSFTNPDLTFQAWHHRMGHISIENGKIKVDGLVSDPEHVMDFALNLLAAAKAARGGE